MMKNRFEADMYCADRRDGRIISDESRGGVKADVEGYSRKLYQKQYALCIDYGGSLHICSLPVPVLFMLYVL